MSGDKPPQPIFERAINPIDQRHPIGDIRTRVFFIVRGILNRAVLQHSLEVLIQEHLRVLGARYRPATKKGHSAYWVFLEEPHYGWTTREVDTTLEASGLIPDVSNPRGAVVWGRPITDHEAAWTPAGWPIDRTDDMIHTPSLLVHITGYTNATVLAVNIPHALADQKGLASMMEAWLTTAEGRPPLEFESFDDGQLDGPSELPMTVLCRKGQYRVKTKSEHFRTILGMLPDLIRNREETRRLLFLSAAVVSRLRDLCNEASQTKADSVVVTNGDIVSSILAKLSHLDRRRPKYLSLGATVNARGRLILVPPTDHHYLHNCPAYACARIKYSRKTPLAEIARAHRRAINETAEHENLERSFAVTNKVFHGAYAMPIGEPGDMTYHTTNWSSAWRNVDFTAVVLKDSDPAAASVRRRTQTERAVSSGGGRHESPMLVFGQAVQRKHKVHRLHAPIFCKGDGGYWCDFACSSKNMALVDKLLDRDPNLHTL